MYFGIYAYAFIYVTIINEKEDKHLKESKVGYLEGLERGRGKGK